MIGASLLVISAMLVSQPPICRGKSRFPYDASQNRTPKPRAVAEIKKAYSMLCPLVMKDGRCGRGEIFENPSVGNNALTFVSGLRQGRKTRALIVYSARFLNGLDREFGPGASFGVLAHEIGHHLTASGNLRSEFDHAWDEELRADYFAGCALAGVGQSISDLERAFKVLAKVASPTHPASGLRNRKLKEGFMQCKKLRDAADKKLEKPGFFGVGAALMKKRGEVPCWRYVYRNSKHIKRVGPVAASRHWSHAFAARKICEEVRAQAREQHGQFSQSCVCE